MKKILLVRPRPHPETIGLQHLMVTEPLELEILGAHLLSDGHQVHLVDLILEKKSLSFFLDFYQPDALLMTGYITHVGILLDLAREAKSWKKKCLVGIGGVHAEVVPEDFQSPHVDAVFSSDPLKSARRLLGGSGEKKQLTAARHLTAGYRHRYYYLFHRPAALIKTATGCPQQCSFCFCRVITGGVYHPRPLDEVIHEIASIKEREIYIVDDDFLVSKERVLAFCQALDEAGLDKKFLIYGRAAFIAENEEVLRRFQRSGLQAVIVGLESARARDLDQYQKGSGLEENERAIAVLKKLGVDLYGTLILGMDFTREDFRSLRHWLIKHQVHLVNLQPLTPLPGTGLYDLYKDQLLVPRTAYEKWDLAHLVLQPEHLPVRAFYGEMIRTYLRVSFSPRALYFLIKKHGLFPVLSLSKGTRRIFWQYLVKMVKGV